VPVWAGDFLSNRRTLLTAGVDRAIRRWDTETGQPLTLRREDPKARWLYLPALPSRHVRDPVCRRAIHGLLLTAWSMAGIFGPVLVNYIREYNVTHGVAPALAYNVTMYVMAGLLVIGFI
jgi:hypothetical protein